MRFRRLGRTNLKVSEIGFGGIPIQRLNSEEAVAIIRRSLDLGINFLDTARAYTTSEERIGEAIRGRRDECLIATKTTARTADEAKKDMDRSFSMLGTSRIDLYQLHNINTEEKLTDIMKPGGSLEAARMAQRSGRIDFIGITSHRPSILIQAIKTNEFDTVMVPLNYVERTPAQELIPLANQLNVGIIVMKPLGGGAFNNAVEALKFVLNYPVSTVIPGVSSIQEVEQDASVGDMPLILEESVQARLEEQAKALGHSFCRGCEYCQPCPEGVPIASILRADSFIKRLGWDNWYTTNKTILQKYEQCQKCRVCESRCPYQLPILELMPNKTHWIREQYDTRKINI